MYFKEVIGYPAHHCDFVLISPWMKTCSSTKLFHCWVIAAKIAAHLCTASNLAMLELVPYRRSKLELCTNYGLVPFGFNSLWQLERFLRKKTVVWMVILSLHKYGYSSLLSIMTPRCLASEVYFRVCPWILYDVCKTFRLLVNRICLHLSGLNAVCQSLSHSRRWLRAVCSDYASSWSFITLYNGRSSAKSGNSWRTLGTGEVKVLYPLELLWITVDCGCYVIRLYRRWTCFSDGPVSVTLCIVSHLLKAMLQIIILDAEILVYSTFKSITLPLWVWLGCHSALLAPAGIASMTRVGRKTLRNWPN